MIERIRKAFPAHPRCYRKKCDAWAEYTLALRVPAKGCPIPEHEPIAIMIRVPLCSDHADKVKPGEFNTSKMRRLVKRICREQGKAEPDFSRAFMQKNPFDV